LTIFEINFLNKRLDAKPNSPATPQDIFLYKQMGASYLCKSINDKIDFDFKKAFAVATYTFAEVIFSKHGNLIKEAGKEKLTTERVLYIGEIEILNSAIKICPKQVPNNIKKNFENTLKKIKKQKNKKK
jgi:hypothetical protein